MYGSTASGDREELGGVRRGEGSRMRLLAETGRILLYIAALVVGIGAVSHVLAWILLRRRTVRFVWAAWNVLGACLLLAGTVALAYAWLVIGFHSGWGSTLAGIGLLL